MVNGVKCVGYARVSTDDKGQDVEGQIREIKKWAEARDNEITGIYTDEMSGAIFPRPGLSRALLDIQMGTADWLVCYDQSRLTRDADSHMWRIKTFAPNICYVVDGDLEPDSLPSNLLHAIKGVTDKEERRILGLRTKIGMETKKAQGVHCGRPYIVALKEEEETAPKGSITSRTKILTRTQLLSFASMGMSPNYLARNVLKINSATIYTLLKRNNLVIEYYESLGKTDFNLNAP